MLLTVEEKKRGQEMLEYNFVTKSRIKKSNQGQSFRGRNPSPRRGKRNQRSYQESNPRNQRIYQESNPRYQESRQQYQDPHQRCQPPNLRY